MLVLLNIILIHLFPEYNFHYKWGGALVLDGVVFGGGAGLFEVLLVVAQRLKPRF